LIIKKLVVLRFTLVPLSDSFFLWQKYFRSFYWIFFKSGIWWHQVVWFGIIYKMAGSTIIL